MSGPVEKEEFGNVPEMILRKGRLVSITPSPEECCVIAVGGTITNFKPLLAALHKHFTPHSSEFVSSLVNAVRNQCPLDPQLIMKEERLVRQALEARGDEHGMSGFKDKVAWFKQEIKYLSCRPELDPTGQGNTSVPLLSFSVYDQRAYRDGKLTIFPSTPMPWDKHTSVIGADPSFVFEFKPSGQTYWPSIRPFLEELSKEVKKNDSRALGALQHMPSSSGNSNLWCASTKDGLDLSLQRWL